MKSGVVLMVLLLFQVVPSIGQFDEDAKRLAAMDYVDRHAHRINCDSVETAMGSRVCANLKFQELDSILNNRFRRYLESLDSDSLKTKVREFQLRWIENRRLQSRAYSEGYRGHMLGIRYLVAMNEATELRIKELETLLEIEEDTHE